MQFVAVALTGAAIQALEAQTASDLAKMDRDLAILNFGRRLDDDDWVDLADIFKADPNAPCQEVAFAGMVWRNFKR